MILLMISSIFPVILNLDYATFLSDRTMENIQRQSSVAICLLHMECNDGRTRTLWAGTSSGSERRRLWRVPHASTEVQIHNVNRYENWPYKDTNPKFLVENESFPIPSWANAALSAAGTLLPLSGRRQRDCYLKVHNLHCLYGEDQELIYNYRAWSCARLADRNGRTRAADAPSQKGKHVWNGHEQDAATY